MTALPLVSVIVPCYNYGHLLHETLDSVLAQTYSQWECIIINDGSTDNTEEVSLAYNQKDTRFRYICQENKGLSGARNTGLEAANGEFIQFLDADDLIHPQKLEKQVEVLLNDASLDIVYGDVYIFEHGSDPFTESVKFKFSATKPVSGYFFSICDELTKDNLFLPCSPLLKRDKVRFMRFNEKLFSLEDWHYWFRCALMGCKFQYDERQIAFARGHGTNMSLNRRRMWKYKIAARMDILNYFKNGVIHQEVIPNKMSLKDHYVLLNLDSSRYHIMFGNLISGFVSSIKYAFLSQKFFYAAYDAAYWLKERIKLSSE